MTRVITTFALTALLTLLVVGPAFASMIACPPSPPPGSTLECGVSNAEPETTLAWDATFADDTEVTGELTTDEDGSGGLAVDIPDDPELSGTTFTITMEDGGSYTGMVGEPEEGAGAQAAADEEDAEEEAETTDAEDDEQVSDAPDEDSEVALGAGGSAGTPGAALLVAVLAGLLVLGGGTQLVRLAVRR